MSIPKKIINHLEKNKIKYKVVPHKKVYTAFDLAETLKEDLKKIAKTLLVKADKGYYLVVVPAHYQINFDKIKKLLKVKSVKLVKEKDILKMLKIKPGSLTPFGTIHNLEVLVDKTFSKVKDILVGAGSFTESLQIKTKDLLKTEEPLLISVGMVKKRKPKKKIAKKKKTFAKKKSTKKKNKPVSKKKVSKEKPIKKKKTVPKKKTTKRKAIKKKPVKKTTAKKRAVKKSIGKGKKRKK